MTASCSQVRDIEAADAGDEQLAIAAQTDPRHFATIYERYANRLYRYALERTGSTQAADDIVSETMVGAIESISRFDPSRGSLAGWLFTIARRRIADRQRSRNRLWRLLNRARSNLAGTDEHGSDAMDDDAVDVRDALTRLSSTDQEVLLLRYSADLSTIQIAEVLEISHSAARVRLTRALGRLKQELGPFDD